MEKYTDFGSTKELNSIKDMDTDTARCLSRYVPKVEVHKEGDATFQMTQNDCSLYQNLTCKDSLEEEIQSRFASFDQHLSSWADVHYPILTEDVHAEF
jgi:hypothetical protein